MNEINRIEITDFHDEALDVYARLSEGQLFHYHEPDLGLFVAESPKVIERAMDAGYEPVSFLMEDTQEKTYEETHGEIHGKTRDYAHALSLLRRFPNVPVYTASLAVLAQLTGFKLTRGMLCAMRRRTLPDAGELIKDMRRIVILENVMNPTNVGAIFRSAAALNMNAVLLTPGCSDPLYRRAARVSMGTVFQIPWTYLDTSIWAWPQDGMKKLGEAGFKTAAMALKKDSVNIDDPKLLCEEKIAVIMGTEGDGLASETIAQCDYTVCIPMSHGVDSLNVAAASAVAFWMLGR